MQTSSRAFGLIFLTLLIDIAAMGMIIPVLPTIIAGFVGGSFAEAARLTGLLTALAAGLESLCAPIIGAFSDRFGRKPTLLALAASLLLSNLALQGLYSTWIFSTTLRFGWGTLQTGLTFAVMGLLAALVQGTLVGPAVKRLGERRSIVIGLSASVLSFLAYAFAPQGWMIYLIIVASSLTALDVPAGQALLAASVGEDEQGALQGALSSVLSLTRIAGPLLATNIFAYFVSPAAPVYFPGAPFAAGALLIAGALVVVWRCVRPAANMQAASEAEQLQLGAVAAD